MFEIENAAYKQNGKTILSAQTLTIQSGKHLLILGPSGCGKTTLMNLMAGLLRTSEGMISFNGQNYTNMPHDALDRMRAENFGFIFQKLHLIGHLTAAQNIALVQKKENRNRIRELTNDLGLSGMEMRHARDLSVGEAQRVAIARAIANDPKVIFADEPTSALDDKNTEKVMDMIFTQAERTGATVVAATHDARIKERFAQILEMTI